MRKKSYSQRELLIKKAKYNLQLFDGFWSIPLAFLIFAVSGTVSVAYFGDALISTEYIQYIVLAAMIMVFANFVVFIGIRFNFRSLQQAVYNKQIKSEISNNLDTWQKVKLYLVLYAFYFVCYLFILYLLMTAIV